VRRSVAILLAAATLAGCSTVRQYLPDNPFSAARSTPVRTIAVLPFAYRAEDGTRACDLCPDTLVMDKTSEQDALLVTAFFHEALTRHPSLTVIPNERILAARGETMEQTLAVIAAEEEIDAVVVGALLELRPRLGDPRDPYQRGGAAIYAALIDMRSGNPVWKRVFDRTPPRPGRAVRQYARLVEGEIPKSYTAHEVSERAADSMVSSLVRAIR